MISDQKETCRPQQRQQQGRPGDGRKHARPANPDLLHVFGRFRAFTDAQVSADAIASSLGSSGHRARSSNETWFHH
jgi:hypothetical protein